MDELYDVYFDGQVQDGEDPGRVREQLGKLFNADERTLDQLFSGKPNAIKRGCDRDTARKYKSAMEKAGAVPVIRAQRRVAKNGGASATAAEKIAALAAAPDRVDYRGDSPAAARAETAPIDDDGIALAPPGTEVLRENERAAPVTREIDTSALQVDTNATRLSEKPDTSPLQLDTSHLSVAEAGTTIPNLPSSEAPLSPDTSAIALSEPGADFSDCARPAPPPPELDLSSLNLEPTGADILDEQYRRKDQTEAPTTDHLSLED